MSGHRIRRADLGQTAFFALVRTVFNTAYRMVYPFLGVFSRALGVDLDTLAWVLSARSLAGGVSAPFLSAFSERQGYRRGMALGLLVFSLGTALVLVWPAFPALAAAIVLGTLGKYIFDPAMQAYLGERVPYEQRGTALAITEMGWSLAFFVGIPVSGFLISRVGWRAPFGALAALGFLTLLGLLVYVRDGAPRLSASNQNFGVVLTSVTALAGLSVGFLASAANEIINLIFGVWLEDSFGLQIAALGGAAAVIGLSELGGEGLVALAADKLGKKRSVALGLSGNMLAAAILPLIGRSVPGALAGLFLFYITFEFTLVAVIPLMTELLPQARATLMAFNISALSLGRAAGAPLATLLYRRGFVAAAGGAILLNLLALAALRRVREQDGQG
ncbi:MAG: MFS transporter [Anaerolineales bacterium]